jgi:hypothetical protein
MEPEEHCVVTARQRRSELKFRAVGVRQISVKSPLEKQRLTCRSMGKSGRSEFSEPRAGQRERKDQKIS